MKRRALPAGKMRPSAASGCCARTGSRVSLPPLGSVSFSEDRDGDDVAGPHGRLVRFGLRCLEFGGGRDHQDGDLAAGGGLAVGDGVVDVELALRADVGDPDHRVVQHGDAHGQPVGGRDGLDHQHAAGGVGVVAEDIHQDAAAAGEQGGVPDGHRGAVAVAGHDVDPDQLLGAGRAVGHEVGDVVGALGGGVEREGLLVRAHGGGGVAVRGDLGEAQRSALGIRVVFERGDRPCPPRRRRRGGPRWRSAAGRPVPGRRR